MQVEALEVTEHKLKGLLQEMTEMAQQQQAALHTLAAQHTDVVAAVENAEALAGRESARANSIESQSLALAKDVERSVARADNLETIVAGLRDERMLWSRELAAQGTVLFPPKQWSRESRMLLNPTPARMKRTCL